MPADDTHQLQEFVTQFPHKIVNVEKAVLLVNQCCNFIPTDDKVLVQKCSQLLWNLVSRQNIVVEGRTLTVSVQWCLNGLKIKDKTVILDILQALDALLRSNVNNIPLLINNVTKEIKFLLGNGKEKRSPEIILLALQCLEACTTVPNDYKSQNRDDLFAQFDLCAEIFMFHLSSKTDSYDDVIHKKLTKQRKHRSSPANKKDSRNTEEFIFDSKSTGYTPAMVSLEYNSDSGTICTGAGGRLKTSDSDFSDSETGKAANIGQIQGRIRQAALNLFCNVVKQTEKSIMFSYWSSFIPEGPTPGQHNLITCILKDSSARGRMAALNVLLQLLTTSKLYLSQAESRGLSLALNEMSVPVLTQVLKCFAALVQATPYHRMSQGIITKVVRNVKRFIYYKDASVQVTALIVLGCTLASEPVISETKEAMIKLKQSHDNEEKEQKLKKEENSFNDNFDFAEFSESDEEENIEYITVPWLLKKCLNNLGVSFLETVQHISNEDTRDLVPIDQCLLFWQTLLNGSLMELLQCEQHPILRAVGCDCLGSIGSHIFEQLPDPGFVVDTAESIYRTLKDDNLMVRVKASWSLGNLSDALVLNSKSGETFEEIPEALILKLLQASISGATDNDKIKMNAVRAIGNLLQLITPQLIRKAMFVEVAEQAFSALVKNCTTGSNMKVRWNACYALGNAMKNSALYQEYTNNASYLNQIWQVCLALGHLTTLLEKDDLLQLEDTIHLYCDTFKTHTHKVLERLVPEKSTALFSASYTLSTLYKQADLNLKQKKRCTTLNRHLQA
ncbi:hypothetical protein NQ314_020301 [Rhamnusium bicolor]|uniref:HEAT repeat-containing protein 6 n=1 Tax=Rhamnusium bicolor TaxID=1586634 RepID=A0AAV8WKG9_9CUCU|nr:hypothetical protein NQ314_020301 [Rhamnusium bicolor]